MKLSQAQLNDLLFTERPFSVLVDGVWQPAVGVYLPPIEVMSKISVKCKLNGKMIVLGIGFYADLSGYDSHMIENHIIQQNISTIPSKKRVVKARGRAGEILTFQVPEFATYAYQVAGDL